MSFVHYEKRELISGLMWGRSLSGLSVPGDPSKIYKWIDYNTFEEEASEIPQGYELREANPEWVEEYKMGSKVRVDPDAPLPLAFEQALHSLAHSGGARYFVLDNGGRPFLVLYDLGSKLSVWKRPSSSYVLQSDWDNEDMSKNTVFYQERVLSLDNVAKVYTGQDDNAVLVQDTDDRITFVGTVITQFYLEAGDEIEGFFSPTGNSDVPYPLILGFQRVYLLLDEEFSIPRTAFGNYEDWMQAYREYYVRSEEPDFVEDAEEIPLCDLVLIQERIY